MKSFNQAKQGDHCLLLEKDMYGTIEEIAELRYFDKLKINDDEDEYPDSLWDLLRDPAYDDYKPEHLIAVVNFITPEEEVDEINRYCLVFDEGDIHIYDETEWAEHIKPKKQDGIEDTETDKTKERIFLAEWYDTIRDKYCYSTYHQETYPNREYIMGIEDIPDSFIPTITEFKSDKDLRDYLA